ncbi:MAG: NAD(P)/FAD-dependent oxidoreductase [Nitrospira sp.]
MPLRVGIIGAGIMGLALAQRLSARGVCVTVLERERQAGGLTTYHDYGLFWWDRFYHVILSSDTQLIQYLHEIGLGDRLRWSAARAGLYAKGRFYSVSTTLELLRFPLVGIIGKLRLARTILACNRIRDWRELESVSVEEWLIRMCGRRTYEAFWKPLLLAKLGAQYKRVSAVFIWSYITRLFSTRDTTAQRNQLGYVSGGYRTVITRLEELIQAAGGTIRLNTPVQAIEPGAHAGITIKINGGHEHFDKVIWTGPIDAGSPLATQGLVSVEASADPIEYLGVVCPVLVTRRPLLPYYTLNLADADVPFTGVIGMSSIVPTDETAGYYLTYFPKYVPTGDPEFHLPDETITQRFFEGARRLFPDLRESDVVGLHLNKAAKVQPLQVLDYSKRVPRVTTRHTDFFVLNTSQFVNSTLNNNAVIRAVNEFVQEHHRCFETAEDRSASARSTLSIP